MKRPWNVVFGASLCYILLVGVVRTFGIFYSAIVERFQSTRAEAAGIMSIQNGVRSLLGTYIHTARGEQLVRYVCKASYRYVYPYIMGCTAC